MTRFLLPRSLKGQLIALTLLAIIVSQIIAFGVLINDRQSALNAEWIRNIFVRANSLIELLHQVPAEYHDGIVKASATRSVRFALAQEPSAAARDGDAASEQDTELNAGFREVLGTNAKSAEVRLYPKPDGLERLSLWAGEWLRDLQGAMPGAETQGDRAPRIIFARFSAQMNDNRWLNVTVAPRPYAPPGWPLAVQMLVMALLSGLAIILVIGRLTMPLKALAESAAALGRGEERPPLREEGPSEVLNTVRAFNEMQDRLTRFVHDRTKMLAAIGHDLRTPITSLRLRAEFIEDDDIRVKILETLDEMQLMAEAALSFAREEAAQEPARIVDIGALISTVCADLADIGKAVKCEEIEGVTLRCRPAAVKRALRNVVENAVSYGQEARVSVALAKNNNEFTIYVDDNGPGIPEDAMETVFKPFVRLENSRSRDTGGVGLGLAIARSTIRSHGGDITLKNCKPGGLRVIISLPGPVFTAKPDIDASSGAGKRKAA
jgi:signal transduction histidine kinase